MEISALEQTLGEMLWDDTYGLQVFMVLSAFVLCSVIGLERQMQQKSAGYRTHVLVGIGSCVFTLISAYGFSYVLGDGVKLDPSRISAQVVSGIGFLGAGVIFKGRNIVRGLTTAATVWVSAAVGMACGAGMVGIAAVLTALVMLTLFLMGPVAHRLPTVDRRRSLLIQYVDGEGVLRSILEVAAEMGFTALVRSTRKMPKRKGRRMVAVHIRFVGRRPLHELVTQLNTVDGVERIRLLSSGRRRSDDDAADE